MVGLTTTIHSCPNKHAQVTNTDGDKSILIYTDGGLDHNNTFLSIQDYICNQVTNKDIEKTILIYTDGGPDHNNTFLS